MSVGEKQRKRERDYVSVSEKKKKNYGKRDRQIKEWRKRNRRFGRERHCV